jgi:hypothetical protein
MTATTQRLSITQNWQQVATSNVTLAGCSTSAVYHIYVGEQPPTAQSAFISDPLLAPTEYNFNAPVWVKLNVTNQLDEVDLIVMGQAVEAVLPPAPPIVVRSMFGNLTDCVYENQQLVATTQNGFYKADFNQPFNSYEFSINPNNYSLALAMNEDDYANKAYLNFEDNYQGYNVSLISNKLGQVFAYQNLPNIGDVKFVVSFTSTGLTLRNQNTGEAFNFDVGVINTLKIKVFGKGGTTSPTVIKEIQAS